MIVPLELSTARLLLRPWRAGDAAALLPILEANRQHLGPWIPRRVAEPVPVPLLAERLAGFGTDFDTNREWRYGIFSSADDKLLGEVGLFPRSPTARVPFVEADRVELGYWLRADETGRGYITEAARAALRGASAVPQFSLCEIRCDARNAASGAVAQRLGFSLATTALESVTDVHLQVWESELSRFGDRGSANI